MIVSLEKYRREKNRGRWYGHNIWLSKKYFSPYRRHYRNDPFYYNRIYGDDEEDEDICPLGYHYHPEHEKSDIYGCMKDSDMVENYSLQNKNTFNVILVFIFILVSFYVIKRLL